MKKPKKKELNINIFNPINNSRKSKKRKKLKMKFMILKNQDQFDLIIKKQDFNAVIQ